MKSKTKLTLAILASLILPLTVLASTGTIDSTNKYAWGSNTGYVNFNPTNGNVEVTSSGLTGDIWSDTYGWINLDPTDAGVTNDGNGNLGGYAWGQNTGYISFSGVTINTSTGIFQGTATGTIVGTINFNCSNCEVLTTWAPTPTPTPTPSSGGGGGGGGGTITAPTITNVALATTTPTSAVVTWMTNYESTSEVDYGTTTAYGLSTTSPAQIYNHSLELSNLSPGTTYHFIVKGTTNYGSSVVSTDYYFTAGSAFSLVSTVPTPTPTQVSNPSASSTVVNASLAFPVPAPLSLINENGTFYLIQNGQLRGITSPGILYSYGFAFSDATPATPADLALPYGSLLLPNSGALVKSQQDKTVYLVSDGQRYGFTSSKVFLGLGFKFSSVLLVTNPELQALPLGADISNASAAHMDGLNIITAGTIYWVFGGVRCPYPSLAIYNSWNLHNDFSKVVPANAADLSLPAGSPVTARVVE
jgi:hypothetical protein